MNKIYPTREICSICGDIVRIGFWVPDDIWREVIPEKSQNDIFCLNCFTKRADDKFMSWDHQILFFPVSLRTHFHLNFERSDK
jgi:hypothetical protein